MAKFFISFSSASFQIGNSNDSKNFVQPLFSWWSYEKCEWNWLSMWRWSCPDLHWQKMSSGIFCLTLLTKLNRSTSSLRLLFCLLRLSWLCFNPVKGNNKGKKRQAQNISESCQLNVVDHSFLYFGPIQGLVHARFYLASGSISTQTYTSLESLQFIE